MAITNLVLSAAAERSMSVRFTAGSTPDQLTFSNLSALLPASLANSAIKVFLDAPRGGVPQTLDALASNGVMLCWGNDAAPGVNFYIAADKAFAGFSGESFFRLSLASSIAS